jgi:hypothetical protein
MKLGVLMRPRLALEYMRALREAARQPLAAVTR